MPLSESTAALGGVAVVASINGPEASAAACIGLAFIKLSAFSPVSPRWNASKSLAVFITVGGSEPPGKLPNSLGVKNSGVLLIAGVGVDVGVFNGIMLRLFCKYPSTA